MMRSSNKILFVACMWEYILITNFGCSVFFSLSCGILYFTPSTCSDVDAQEQLIQFEITMHTTMCWTILRRPGDGRLRPTWTQLIDGCYSLSSTDRPQSIVCVAVLLIIIFGWVSTCSFRRKWHGPPIRTPMLYFTQMISATNVTRSNTVLTFSTTKVGFRKKTKPQK